MTIISYIPPNGEVCFFCESVICFILVFIYLTGMCMFVCIFTPAPSVAPGNFSMETMNSEKSNKLIDMRLSWMVSSYT